MRKQLGKEFFNRDADVVARELLGKFLVSGKGAFKITETEAYMGPHDLASHASKGRTTRTEVMFGAPGTFYLYFCYGVHWMLNVVTREKGYPAAVLIRGIEGASGPGRMTKFLGLTGRLNGLPASKKTGVWFEDRGEKEGKIQRTPRIGVGYAKEWALKKLRYVLVEELRRRSGAV